MADRVERLTNLLALLLETPEPVTLVEIAGELAGQYPETQQARRAAFERDKAALRGIGVPIDSEVVVGGPYAGSTRYRVDRARYELDGLQLDDDEARALQVALAATRPRSSSGQDALWKLGGGLAEGPGHVGAVVPDVPGLPVLRTAVSSGHRVAFRYRDVERRVDPWGLLLRNGFWYVVGFDHTRGERRTYRVDRVEGDIEILHDEPFDRPTDFDVRDALPADPKLLGATDDDLPVARVRIAANRASLTRRELGDDRVVAEHDDGSVEVLVPCANRLAFRSWLLGHLTDAWVLEPADVRDDVITWLQATVAAAPETGEDR